MTNYLAECQAKGSDEEFLAWTRTQPSWISNQYCEFPNGEERNPACHVRRVKNGSGMAIKPPYSALPMTNDEHDIQTRQGELACLEKHFTRKQFVNAFYGIFYMSEVEIAKDIFDEALIEHRRKWIES